MKIERALEHPELIAIVVEAEGVSCGPSSPALDAHCESVVSANSDPVDDTRKAAVRDLLRHGGHKPSGRGKPASEYLRGAAAKGNFPRIGAAVDVCNLHSLASGLPISLLDREKATAGEATLELRIGADGESYVFNPAGHEITLRGLLLVARQGGDAVGNPVKDSLATRTDAETKDVVAVVYGSRRLLTDDDARAFGEALANDLVRFAGATRTSVELA